MKLNFLEFIHSLNNLEKNRNFQSLKKYDIDSFENYILKKTTIDRNQIKISVVGTNGKGSISHYLSQIFQFQLFKVGLYTSPHLLSPLERIKIQNKILPIEEYNQLLKNIYDENLEKCSFFEIFTLFSILLFQKNHCEIGIYEAGLGGRLDATKVVQADYVVLCSIGKDHTEILGNTIEKILNEKLNISSEKTKLLFYFFQEEKIQKQIQNFQVPNLCFSQKIEKSTYLQFNFEYARFICKEILKRENKKSICVHLHQMKQPEGRMQIISMNPLILFDVAHNFDAVQILLETVQNSYPNLKFDIFLGFLKDKNVKPVFKLIETFSLHRKISILEGELFYQKSEQNTQTFCIDNLGNYLKETSENTLIFGSFRIYSYLKL